MSLNLYAHARSPTYPKKNKRKKKPEELKQREDIVITNADKGGTVVKDVKDYTKVFEKQLTPNNTTNI